jgi:hypothetical protein
MTRRPRHFERSSGGPSGGPGESPGASAPEASAAERPSPLSTPHRAPADDGGRPAAWPAVVIAAPRAGALVAGAEPRRS